MKMVLSPYMDPVWNSDQIPGCKIFPGGDYYGRTLYFT